MGDQSGSRTPRIKALNKEKDASKAYKVMKAQMSIERLREAMRRREQEPLERAIEEAKRQGVEADDEDLLEAERELEITKVRKRLKEARQSHDVARIEEEVAAIKRNKWYLGRLQREVQEADSFIEQLMRLQRLKMTILNMDKKTMTEMRRYSSPPMKVHRVMQGAWLILGADEEETGEWRDVQRLMNPQGMTGMNRKILDFNVASVNPEIAARVRYILENENDKGRGDDETFDPRPYGLQDVQAVSSGAGTFYVWAMGMVEEVEALNKGGSAQPANIRRQKEILHHTPSSPQRKRKF